MPFDVGLLEDKKASFDASDCSFLGPPPQGEYLVGELKRLHEAKRWKRKKRERSTGHFEWHHFPAGFDEMDYCPCCRSFVSGLRRERMGAGEGKRLFICIHAIGAEH